MTTDRTRAATRMGSLLSPEGIVCVLSLIFSFATLSNPEVPHADTGPVTPNVHQEEDQFDKQT
jgi:hypothetical protein